MFLPSLLWLSKPLFLLQLLCWTISSRSRKLSRGIDEYNRLSGIMLKEPMEYLRDTNISGMMPWNELLFSLMFYYFFPMASVYLMEGRTSYLFESWCLRCITMHMFFMGNKVAFTLVILGLMEFNVDFSWFWTCIVSTKQLVNRRVQATGWNWFFGEIMEHLRATLETGRETLR